MGTVTEFFTESHRETQRGTEIHGEEIHIGDAEFFYKTTSENIPLVVSF